MINRPWLLPIEMWILLDESMLMTIGSLQDLMRKLKLLDIFPEIQLTKPKKGIRNLMVTLE